MKQRTHIYITHPMPIGSIMYDFFILKRVNSEYHSYSNFVGDYWMSECEVVKKFLKTNPIYVYVGSSDNYTHKPKIPFGFREYKQ